MGLAFYCSCLGLELIPQGNLHLPHVGGSAGVSTKSCCSRGCPQSVDETRKVRMIQDVEDLPAKLEILVFSDSNLFGHSHVVISESIQTQVVASAGSLISGERLCQTAKVDIAGKRAGMYLSSIAICPYGSCAQEERISNGE